MSELVRLLAVVKGEKMRYLFLVSNHDEVYFFILHLILFSVISQIGKDEVEESK
jgi:hypothetical protein